MIRREDFLELYFRAVTILFWSIVIYNWIFILNKDINTSIVYFFLAFSSLYLIVFTVCKLKEKNYITFLYRFISTLTFIVSTLYILLLSNSLGLLIVKSLMILIYFYISFLKVFTEKDDEGIVGIIGSILLFIFGIYY